MVNFQEESKLKQNFLHISSGFISGALSRTIIAPIDRVVILKQIHSLKYANLSMIPLYQKMISTEGILSIYKGNGINCLRMAPFTGIEFFMYDQFKQLSEQLFRSQQNKQISYLISGTLAGMTASTCVYPLDLVRTIFSTQTESQQQYKGIWSSLQIIYKQNGFRGLYKGWGVTMCGIGPYSGLKLMTFNTFQNIFYIEGKKIDNFKNFLMGSASGCFAVTLTYPTDLLRKQLHVQILNKQNLGIIGIIQQIYSTKGMSGFYKGLLYTYIKIVPLTGLCFTFNEKLKNIFQLQKQQN